MRSRLILLLATPAAILSLLAALGFWQDLGFRKQSVPHPKIEYDTQIDFPEQEYGAEITANIELSNSGAMPLLISEINTSSCSCHGLERSFANGERTRVETMELQPGESSRLLLRIRVRDVVGGAQNTLLSFRTNDPEQPTARIRIVVPYVWGGVRALPTTLVVGDIELGAEVTKTLHVFDDAVVAREIESVESTNPDQVVATLVPPDPAIQQLRSDHGRVIAGVSVSIMTSKPGPINASLSLRLKGSTRKPDSVVVVGNVCDVFSVLPERLRLPVATSQGAIDQGRCIVRAANGENLDLSLDQVSTGLRAEIVGGNGPVRTIVISTDPTVQDPGPVAGEVRVIASVGEKRRTLTIPVIVSRELIR